MLLQTGNAEGCSTSQRAQYNLTKTVIIVCIGFIICWSCNQWYFFVYNTGIPLSFYGPFYNFTVAMVSLHCCINPIIYIANYEQFRSAVYKIFRLKKNRVTAASLPMSVP